LFEGLTEILAILHPARHIERALQCLSVFTSDLAAFAPPEEALNTFGLAGELGACEMMNLVKTSADPKFAPTRFELGKPRVS